MIKKLILFFVVGFCWNINCVKQEHLVNKNVTGKLTQLCKSDSVRTKKKILIFTSKGGGGHMSVSKALRNFLEDSYDVTITNFFEEVMCTVDTIKSVTFGRADSEDVYNFCLRHRFTTLANCFTKFGSWVLKYREPLIEPLVLNYIDAKKPDLIVSVIPMVNFAILPVARKHNIPFLVVTNDLDTTNYINGISSINYKKFFYTIAFRDGGIISKFKPAKIPHSQVAVTGFPLRAEFFDSNKNQVAIKKDFDIPLDKKVVMVLMGGAGSFACYSYVQTLLRLKNTMHVVVCIGRDEKLRKLISRLKLPSHISISIVGFTERISDLMSVSDVLITKSGPGSICEAIASGLPLLIDQTSGTLFWESLNIDFVKKHNLGEVITKFNDVSSKINKFLEDSTYICSVKRRMSRLQSGLNFRKRIRCLVKKIMI